MAGGLSKNMQTLNAHLREQNERDVRRQRQRQPPIGTGTYLHDCAECGRPFRSEDQYAVLCGPCDAEDVARYNHQPDGRSYNFEQFRRGRRRD